MDISRDPHSPRNCCIHLRFGDVAKLIYRPTAFRECYDATIEIIDSLGHYSYADQAVQNLTRDAVASACYDDILLNDELRPSLNFYRNNRRFFKREMTLTFARCPDFTLRALTRP
jgi:hypothetical protein